MLSKQLRDYIESLSIVSAAVVVAVLSAAVVWILAVAWPDLRKLWAASVPFAVAFCLLVARVVGRGSI